MIFELLIVKSSQVVLYKEVINSLHIMLCVTIDVVSCPQLYIANN